MDITKDIIDFLIPKVQQYHANSTVAAKTAIGCMLPKFELVSIRMLILFAVPFLHC